MVLADGARALSWSADRTLRLWDLASGASRALEGHSDWVVARWCWPTARAPCRGQRTARCACGTWRAARAGRSKGTATVSGAVVLADGARALSWSGTGTLRLGTWRAARAGRSKGTAARSTGAVVLADGARALSWSCGPHAAPVGSGERARAGRSKGTATGSMARCCWPTARAPCRGQRTARCGCGIWRAAEPGARRAQRRGHWRGGVGRRRARPVRWSRWGPHVAPVGPGERPEPGARRAQRWGHWCGAVGRRRASPVVVWGLWVGDRMLRLWDLASGQSRALEGHTRWCWWRGAVGRRRARPVVGWVPQVH